uniref:Transmembrane protein n=1 Tax=Heterorhabditis bacteriophora TaxID=37862 RepID=A0A1I7X743_HETBA
MEDKVNISSSTTDNTKPLQYLVHNEQEINQQTVEVRINILELFGTLLVQLITAYIYSPLTSSIFQLRSKSTS